MAFDFNELARYSVAVESAASAGSGTVIAHTETASYILTCYHVVNGLNGKIEYPGKNKSASISYKVKAQDIKLDLALLETSSPIPLPAIPISKHDPDHYETIYIIGNPNGFRLIPTSGIYCGPINRHGTTTLVSNAFISPGISGGTAVNFDCELIGLPSNVWREGEELIYSLGYMVSRKAILRFLRKHL